MNRVEFRGAPFLPSALHLAGGGGCPVILEKRTLQLRKNERGRSTNQIVSPVFRRNGTFLCSRKMSLSALAALGLSPCMIVPFGSGDFKEPTTLSVERENCALLLCLLLCSAAELCCCTLLLWSATVQGKCFRPAAVRWANSGLRELPLWGGVTAVASC